MELLLNPEIFAELGVVFQVKRAPGEFDVRVTAVLVLSQIVFDRGLFDRFGVG